MNDSFKDHALNLFSTGFHIDGRKLDEYREISYETGISNQSAEGSARVKIGMTEVVVGIKMEIGEPFPDRLDEGGIIVNAELKPFSSWKYDSGPPGINAIELSRLVDRVIREGKYLDLKKLCITEDNVICALQKGGMTPLTAEEIDKMVDLAMKKTKELREIIK